MLENTQEKDEDEDEGEEFGQGDLAMFAIGTCLNLKDNPSNVPFRPKSLVRQM